MKTAPFQRATVDMIPGFTAGPTKIFWRRLRIWASRKVAASFIHWQTPEALGPAAALLRQARAREVELVIVHNEVAHWVGTRLIHRGRRVAADIEDWHSEDLLPEARTTRPLELIRRNENLLLHEAVYTTTTSESLASALHERYGGKKPHVISNSFPLQIGVSTRATPTVPVFFWFSQTLGPGRGIEHFLAAWQKTNPTSQVVLLGTSQGSYAQELAASLPPEKRSLISFRSLVAPDDLPGVIAEYDIGLALEDDNVPNRNLTITNKILQYLNAGLAVIASNTAGQQEVLSRGPGAGILVAMKDTETFAAQLNRLLEEPELLSQMKLRARTLANETYNWEKESGRLVALVSSVLPTHKASDAF